MFYAKLHEKVLQSIVLQQNTNYLVQAIRVDGYVKLWEIEPLTFDLA